MIRYIIMQADESFFLDKRLAHLCEKEGVEFVRRLEWWRRPDLGFDMYEFKVECREH